MTAMKVTYKVTLGKRHEARLQEVRHERKTELARLDDLKKTLQMKLRASHTEKTQAA